MEQAGVRPRPKVFAACPLPAEAEHLLAASVDLEVWPEDTRAPRSLIIEKASTCDALLLTYEDPADAEVLQAGAGRRRVVGNFAVGYNNVDVPAATRLGI